MWRVDSVIGDKRFIVRTNNKMNSERGENLGISGRKRDKIKTLYDNNAEASCSDRSIRDT